ncbi:HAD hydrolase-like protein [Thalassospira sp. ER-Se-21-Dark]|uniref:HAD family hydrolase n=1 Tax=Thalassospira sp. ER-Se-21-Dark TaxID=2585190 RepID=UPI001B30E112|nr:HAD hydrolase-like protein [Thalassospira sp. ER-Se-21-Dark]MBP3126194.1 HAD family hydrolase [Thalassospira sp. ER-Se-21-Dark]
MNYAFDLDGTLITARQRQMTLLQAVARRIDVPISENVIWQKKREGISTQAALLEIGVNEAKAMEIARAWLQDIETPYWLSLDTLFDDTLTVLESFRKIGKSLILLTARQNKSLLLQQLTRLGIQEYFEAVEYVSPFFAVDEKARVLSQRTFSGFVGDSETDFDAAKRTGTPFYAVSTGQRSPTFLSGLGVGCVHSSLLEVRDAIFDAVLDS